MLLSSVKKLSPESGEKYAQITVFFSTGQSVIMDSYFSLKQHLNNRFDSYKHSAFCFSNHKLMDWNGLLWCFQLFGLSFWWHPFTVEDPLVNKWLCSTFSAIFLYLDILPLQMFILKKKKVYLHNNVLWLDKIFWYEYHISFIAVYICIYISTIDSFVSFFKGIVGT